MSTTADEHIGTELLGYRIEALIGRGGMGVVYRAYDRRLKRKVALKLLAPELAGDERFRERFLRESELAASLDHPNVVPIYEAGEADGVLYVAMRLVDGKSLKTLITAGRTLAPARALAIAGQVAAALDAAHEQGLVHRDVKPSNVLLDQREHVYLADFGLTRRLGEPEASLGTSFSLGTPAYVAPEQIEGTEVDGRADEYSLCCLLYECLFGQPPFPRTSDAAVLFAHLEEEPPAPERLARVVARGLAKDPARRYPSCTELVEAAKDALGITEPRRPRRPYAFAGAGAVLLAAAVIAVVLDRSDSVRSPTIPGNAIAVIDPGSDRVTEQVPVGVRPEGIAYGAGSLWVANLDDRTVQHVDPATAQVVRTLFVGEKPTGIAASSRAVWVVGSSPSRSSLDVRRIDPRFDAIAKTTRIPNAVTGSGGSVATRGNALWVAPTYGLLSRLDPRTSRVVEKIDPGGGPAALAVGADGVWLTDPDANTVTRADPSGHLSPIAVRGRPSAIAAGAGAVWVAAFDDDAVVRIDPRTRKVTKTIPVGAAPRGIAVGAGSVWVANSRDGTVTRIDPATHTVAKTIHVGGSPQRIVVAEGRVWVTVQPETAGGTESAVQGGTARLVEGRDTNEVEGAGVYPDNDPQLAYATCAKLLNYPDKPAPAGSRLVPEVAASLPSVSAGGRTYTFTIRAGFRFSPPSNEPVTARTFKYSLEWALDPRRQSDARSYYDDIVGAEAYMAGNAPHIVGIRARGNELSIRLLAPAPDFPSRLAMPYTCAVPVGTPLDPKGLVPIPMAGPYHVSSYTPGQQLVLERNPNYGGSRPRRLARIEVSFGVSEKARLAEIESGSADYALGAVTVQPAEIARLVARYGPRSPAAKDGAQRFFRHPQLRLRFFFLNPHRFPFQDVRLRRAVNYAIDRRALARIPVQEGALAPTDQYLPPGVPGFRDAHVYPFTPDLAEARRLAGDKKRSAVLYSCNEAPCDRIATVVKRNLKAIGISVEIERLPWPVLWGTYFDDNPRFDLALASWTPFYPDPVESLRPFIGDFPLGDPARDREVAAAARLPFGFRRDLAYEKIDADLSRISAPWLPYANSLSADFFSERMGCQVYNPVYGIDLAALCIRKR